MTVQNLPPVAIYRFFAPDGWLLYVGMTVNPEMRFAAHRRHAPWWALADPRRTAVTWYDSREEAAAAEVLAIKTERPEWNLVGSDGYRGGRPKTVLSEGQERKLESVVALYREQQVIHAEYKQALAELTKPEGDAVPIAYIAQQLGIQRKTVYRHLGRSMT